MKAVLLVSTVPALESYSIGVIKAALNNRAIDCHACVFLSGNDLRSAEELLECYGLADADSGALTFFRLAKNKVKRILAAKHYLDQVIRLAQTLRCGKIHFITQDVMLAGHVNKFKEFQLYYTVHDLVPHASTLSFAQQTKHYYFRIRKDKLLIKAIGNLVSNSEHQYRLLKQSYPHKNILMHEMPSLVTPAIKTGERQAIELRAHVNYVLFFGRIELYKGVEDLYQAFLNNEGLRSVKLVIAGKGEIYFKRKIADEQNIIFINRYIDEDEIGTLFKNAMMLVLPYHKATQSAVASIAYHYHKPVVAAAIDGLRENVIHGKTGLLYDHQLPTALYETIFHLYKDNQLHQEISEYLNAAQPFFEEGRLGKQLSIIYSAV